MRTRLLAPFLVLLASPAARSQQPETALPLVEGSEPLLVHAGAHVTGGLISPPTDVDVLTFVGVAGETIRLRLRSHANGLDPQIQVYDPSFSLLASNWCDGKSGIPATACTVALDLVSLPASGTYTIVLGDVGVNESGGYGFQLERYLPKLPSPGMPNGTTSVETLSPSTDFDHLTFEGSAGSVVVVNLQSLTNGLDPQLELIDPSGAVVVAPWCDGKSGIPAGACSLSFQQALPLTGTYTIILSDVGADEVGNVHVSVTCILGACPTTAAGLGRDVSTVSLSAGGTQNLALDAGPTRAFQPFLLLGSASGHVPGLPVSATTCLPLNVDPYFFFTFNRPFQPPYSASSTSLDAAGRASVALTIPAGAPAALAGLSLHHAFLSFAGAPSSSNLAFTSNAVGLTLGP